MAVAQTVFRHTTWGLSVDKPLPVAAGRDQDNLLCSSPWQPVPVPPGPLPPRGQRLYWGLSIDKPPTQNQWTEEDYWSVIRMWDIKLDPQPPKGQKMYWGLSVDRPPILGTGQDLDYRLCASPWQAVPVPLDQQPPPRGEIMYWGLSVDKPPSSKPWDEEDYWSIVRSWDPPPPQPAFITGQKLYWGLSIDSPPLRSPESLLTVIKVWQPDIIIPQPKIYIPQGLVVVVSVNMWHPEIYNLLPIKNEIIPY